MRMLWCLSILIVTSVVTPVNADAGWRKQVFEVKGSEFLVKTGLLPDSWLKIVLSALGDGAAGTSVASAGWPWSANQSVGVAGIRVVTWTWEPAAGEPPLGEVEYEGHLEVTCAASVPNGPAMARARGTVSLLIKKDGKDRQFAFAGVDVTQTTERQRVGSIAPTVGGLGIGSVDVVSHGGEGDVKDENKQSITPDNFCCKEVQRIHESSVLHHLKVDGPFSLFTAKASADTLARTIWNYWNLIPYCGGGV